MNSPKVPGLNPQKDGSVAMTIEVPNGNLKPEILEAMGKVSSMPGITVHITTAQKIMFLGLDDESGQRVMDIMESAGASVRKGRTLSHARTCVGQPWCKFAWQDTFAFGEYLYEKAGAEITAPKMKLGIAGCPACCSWANMVDLGFVGVKSGWKVFAAGHGGARPKTGIEIAKVTNVEDAAELTLKVARFFTANVKKKSRLDRVIDKIGGIEAFKREIGIE